MANFAAFKSVVADGMTRAGAFAGVVAEAGVLGVAEDMSAVVLEKGQ